MFFFFQAEDGIRDWSVTGVQTCALPISRVSANKAFLPGITRGNPAAGRAEFIADEEGGVDVAQPGGGRKLKLRDRKSVRVGKECRSRWRRSHAEKMYRMELTWMSDSAWM